MNLLINGKIPSEKHDIQKEQELFSIFKESILENYDIFSFLIGKEETNKLILEVGPIKNITYIREFVDAGVAIPILVGAFVGHMVGKRRSMEMKACKDSKDKKTCIKNYWIKVHTDIINELKKSKATCGKQKNPAKCKTAFDKIIKRHTDAIEKQKRK